MSLEHFFPDALPVWAALFTVAAAFLSSALTAAFGIGGGLALLAVMSALFPPAAVVPVHGVAQLGSNASRFILTLRNTVWPIVFYFSLGGIIGALIGGKIAISIPVWALRIGVAAFILLTVWGPKLKSSEPGVKTFILTGAVGSFLTMFFGATGPIAATMLSATKLARLNVVATLAACMVAQHGLKVAVFGALGFAYGEWLILIALIVLAVFAGAYVGTHYLKRMPEALFRRGFNTALTIIAAYLLVAGIFDLFFGSASRL